MEASEAKQMTQAAIDRKIQEDNDEQDRLDRIEQDRQQVVLELAKKLHDEVDVAIMEAANNGRTLAKPLINGPTMSQGKTDDETYQAEYRANTNFYEAIGILKNQLISEGFECQVGSTEGDSVTFSFIIDWAEQKQKKARKNPLARISELKLFSWLKDI